MLATCALMGAVSLLPLSCPSAQLQEMYNCAVRLVSEPVSASDAGRCEERRLGCLMLSCLACNLPMAMLEVRIAARGKCSTAHVCYSVALWQVMADAHDLITLTGIRAHKDACESTQACEQQVLDCLTTDAFGSTGAQRMDIAAYKDKTPAERAAAFMREATWRCAALEALHAWLVGYVCHLPPRRRSALCMAAAEALRPVTALFTDPECGRRMRDPLSAGDDPAAAAALMTFQYRLLDVYLAMPYAEAYEDCWVGLLALCSEPLREGASHLSPHSRRAVAGQLLPPLLNSQDEALAAHLGCEDDGFALVRMVLMLASPHRVALCTRSSDRASTLRLRAASHQQDWPFVVMAVSAQSTCRWRRTRWSMRW